MIEALGMDVDARTYGKLFSEDGEYALDEWLKRFAMRGSV